MMVFLWIYRFSFSHSCRCLTQDGIRLLTETVGPATRTATETEEGDKGTEDHPPTHPAVTESVTEEGGDTDPTEAMEEPGGLSPRAAVFVGFPLQISKESPFLMQIFVFLLVLYSRSYDNRSMEHRPYDRRYCEGYRRLDPSRDQDRDREPHGTAESYYPREFSPNLYDYRRGREKERERSYQRKGSRRKHKRRRRKTRSYSQSSSVSTTMSETVL